VNNPLKFSDPTGMKTLWRRIEDGGGFAGYVKDFQDDFEQHLQKPGQRFKDFDGYTYNWSTGQYEDSYGNAVSYETIYTCLMSSGSLVWGGDFTGEGTSWALGDSQMNNFGAGSIYHGAGKGTIDDPVQLNEVVVRAVNRQNSASEAFFRNGVESMMRGIDANAGTASTTITILDKNYMYNEVWHQTQTRGLSTIFNRARWTNPGAKYWRTIQKEPFDGIRAAGDKLAIAGVVLVAADIVMTGEVKWSDLINGGMAAASFSGIGSVIAGVWFIADFGTMGVNIIMGNGHVGLGDMIDKWAGGPIIKMYNGLY